MVWEFRTEPEFKSMLAWMRTFARDEIWPIETIASVQARLRLDCCSVWAD